MTEQPLRPPDTDVPQDPDGTVWPPAVDDDPAGLDDGPDDPAEVVE